MKQLQVRSTVIDWQDSTLEITDTTGVKYIVPLTQSITVTMIGYPTREQKTMPARELGRYMERGYRIELISYDE